MALRMLVYVGLLYQELVKHKQLTREGRLQCALVGCLCPARSRHLIVAAVGARVHGSGLGRGKRLSAGPSTE